VVGGLSPGHQFSRDGRMRCTVHAERHGRPPADFCAWSSQSPKPGCGRPPSTLRRKAAPSPPRRSMRLFRCRLAPQHQASGCKRRDQLVEHGGALTQVPPAHRNMYDVGDLPDQPMPLAEFLDDLADAAFELANIALAWMGRAGAGQQRGWWSDRPGNGACRWSEFSAARRLMLLRRSRGIDNRGEGAVFRTDSSLNWRCGNVSQIDVRGQAHGAQRQS
jgi:hypothetical protein